MFYLVNLINFRLCRRASFIRTKPTASSFNKSYCIGFFMASLMEQPPNHSGRRDETDFNLREWALKARLNRGNTNSRRFSASNIRSLREEARSFRSNVTISSTVSSPGYNFRDGIDPSTYSFTNALKALQARSGYGQDCLLSPEGYALNSKWNDAEKYICNPLSGEVPAECLSAKSLSGRSIPTLTTRKTISGPVSYSSHSRIVQAYLTTPQEDHIQYPIQEKKVQSLTRDVGTQSTPPELSSSSPSPASTPSIKERSLKFYRAENVESPNSGEKLNCDATIEVKKTREKEVATRNKQRKHMCVFMQGGCLSWNLWMKKGQREKQNPRLQVYIGKVNIMPVCKIKGRAKELVKKEIVEKEGREFCRN